ncbi:hypothetical protein C0J52_04790 [Blattella germanica]|nr:hypothetical protein C0J52_04790 [Blattella germanica]
MFIITNVSSHCIIYNNSVSNSVDDVFTLISSCLAAVEYRTERYSDFFTLKAAFDNSYACDPACVIDITVTATSVTDCITLHYVDMEIVETPSVTPLDRLQNLEVVNTTYDNETNFYTLQLNTSLVKERSYRIHIKYTANLNGDVLGFYKCFYNHNKKQRWFAVTYFEPHHARKAFPCFDEPILKARFRISIARLPGYNAISNMPRENSSEADPNIGGRIWDTFQETPPISTYLVAVMVSDFKNLTSADGRFTIWGVENVIQRASYALSIIPSIVEAMENYTGIKYTLPKLDSVAEPCFRGGMENWGMLKPDWRKEEQFVVNLLQITMFFDVQTPLPMRDVIENISEAIIHVSIVYGKDNLFQIIEDQQRADRILPDDVDIKSVMDTWTLQGSFPIISVQRKNGSSEFVLEDGSASTGSALWWIPISYTTSTDINFNNTRPRAWMKGERSIRLPKPLNESEVNYDVHTWMLITNYLKSPNFRKIQAVNRAQLLDDAFALANCSLLNLTIALELSLYLAEETDYIPWATFFTILSHINEYLLISDNYALFLMKKIYHSIDEEAHVDDSQITKLSRFNILYWSCYLGYSKCLKWASAQYKSWLSNPKNTTLSLDLKAVVLCTALSYDKDADWENMWNVMVEYNKTTEILYLLAYLQCTVYYKDIMMRYSNLTLTILDSELEDLDSSGTAIRGGLRTSYMHVFNNELNYTVSVFSNLDKSSQPISANTTVV